MSQLHRWVAFPWFPILNTVVFYVLHKQQVFTTPLTGFVTEFVRVAELSIIHISISSKSRERKSVICLTHLTCISNIAAHSQMKKEKCGGFAVFLAFIKKSSARLHDHFYPDEVMHLASFLPTLFIPRVYVPVDGGWFHVRCHPWVTSVGVWIPPRSALCSLRCLLLTG